MMLYFTPELHYSRGNQYGLMVCLSFAFASDCSGGVYVCNVYVCVCMIKSHQRPEVIKGIEISCICMVIK